MVVACRVYHTGRGAQGVARKAWRAGCGAQGVWHARCAVHSVTAYLLLRSRCIVSHLSALQGACVGTLLSLRLHRPPTQRTALCAAALRTSSVSILLRAVRLCATPVAISTTCAAISAALGATLCVAVGLARLIIRLHSLLAVGGWLRPMLGLHRLTGHTQREA